MRISHRRMAIMALGWGTTMRAYYYVDATGGNDANNGRSEAQAWKTLTKVNASTFAPGDRILFKAGETWKATAALPYSAAIICSNSGVSGSPIYYGKYSTGADPIFDQCIIYTDWAVYDNPTYRRADGDTTAGRGVFEGASRYIKTTSVANVKITAGSYYVTGGYIYVHTTTGADPNGMTVGYPNNGTYPSGFYCNGKSYITAEHLSMYRACQHGFHAGDDVTGFTALYCTGSWCNGRGFRICYETTAAHIPKSCKVANCIAYDNAAEGIWTNGTNTIIENNEIYNGCKDWATKNIGNGIDSGGIIIGVYSDGGICRNNYIHDIYHAGLLWLEQEGAEGEPARPKNCLIYDNHLLNNVAGTGNSVYIEGDSTCKIYNNIIESTSGASIGKNIVIDYAASNPKIYHNTLINRKGSYCIEMNDAAIATIKNNIFRDITGSYLMSISAGCSATLSNNRYSGSGNGLNFHADVGATAYELADWAAYCAATGETNSAIGSPGLVDEASNYHLVVGSACRSAGANLLTDVPVDYDNVARDSAPDIGAYEYV